MSTLVHFYSYATGVSLELPAGFERAGEDESSATYAVLDDDGAAGPKAPLLTVQVIGTFEGDVDDADRREAVSRLADGFARGDGVVLSRVERTVDGAPTETVALRQPDGTLLHLTGAASETRLISVAGRTADETGLDDFDATVRSMRFIEL